MDTVREIMRTELVTVGPVAANYLGFERFFTLGPPRFGQTLDKRRPPTVRGRGAAALPHRSPASGSPRGPLVASDAEQVVADLRAAMSGGSASPIPKL